MWEKNSALLLVLATAAILVGTMVTMVVPFAYVNTERDAIASVVPYTALELAGRDVYIKEGCNNCHTQTVRPLVAEVIRYGDYSKSGEFVYDRPHLWGSRRTGPDLARVGGKYPDQWHYQHMRDPASMAPGSNMPAYGFLDNRRVNPELTRRKLEVLGFPYAEEEIIALAGKTDMDAIVAYMQKLGSDIPWREQARTTLVGELSNPYSGDQAAIAEGRDLYAQNCAACHGSGLKGGFAADLSVLGYTEEVFFQVIHDGILPLGMPGFSALGSERIWKIVSYLASEQKAQPPADQALTAPEASAAPAVAEAASNPYRDDAAAIGAGRDLYGQRCAACHGPGLKGGFAPDLSRWADSDEKLFELIHDGRLAAGMPGFSPLGAERIWQIVSYIASGQVDQ